MNSAELLIVLLLIIIYHIVVIVIVMIMIVILILIIIIVLWWCRNPSCILYQCSPNHLYFIKIMYLSIIIYNCYEVELCLMHECSAVHVGIHTWHSPKSRNPIWTRNLAVALNGKGNSSNSGCSREDGKYDELHELWSCISLDQIIVRKLFDVTAIAGFCIYFLC